MSTISNAVREELTKKIIECLDDGYDGYVCDLHNEVFNTDYFIVGYYQAEEWLKANYGIFAAIEKIKEYEQDNFGEVNTDLSSSESVVNMLVYILGEELLWDVQTIQDNWNDRVTPELAAAIKAEL